MSSLSLQRAMAMVLTVIAINCISLSAWARSSSPAPATAASFIVESFRQQPGTTLYLTLTGSTSGSVWGSGIYTYDSNLATAAVHAGVIAPGETKTVKVSVLPGQTNYAGSTSHGVTSYAYGAYIAGSVMLEPDDGGDNPVLPDPVSLRDFETATGGVFRFKVRANAQAGGVWGTNAYTSDSVLASSAVHAGVLVDGQIGVVRVTVLPPQVSHVGSNVNGINSAAYGQYSGSYAVSNESGSTALTAYPGMLANPLEYLANLSGYRGRNGGALHFKVVGSNSGGIWGTGTYTDDSTLAVATVHSGLLAVGQSGVIKVTIRPGLTATANQPTPYLASTANGITSNSYGSYSGSMVPSNPDGAMGTIARVTSATTASPQLLQAFRYQITANPAATNYNATGLPEGLTVEPLTGVISGIPRVSGTFAVQLLVTNSSGTSNAALRLKIDAGSVASASPGFLSVIGPATLQSGGRTTLSVIARYSDSSVRTVQPVWSSSDPDAAVVSATGVLAAGVVVVDTPVTLSASFTENGVTVQASLQVTIMAAPAVLVGLRLEGAASVQSGGNLRLTVNALYTDGSVRPVTGSAFTLSRPDLGSVNSRGVLSVATLTEDTALAVTASYSERGVTKAASLAVSIVAAPAGLLRLTLVGAQGTLTSGQTLSLAAEGVYDDGSRKRVNAIWLVSGTAASISSTGVLSARVVQADTPAVVKASYTEGSTSVTAQYQLLIQAAAPPIPVQAEVETTGPQTDFGLSLWSSWGAASAGIVPRNAARDVTTPTAGYKLFVVAAIPGGVLLPSTTLFMLNRNREWGLLGFPMAEYLSGVAENSFQLIEIFDHLDSSLITGTQIYVGYGLTDTEMIAARRYRLAYQVQ
ncbi:MAG: LCCL domain-containing protein [Burkholderiales bacterium]